MAARFSFGAELPFGSRWGYLEVRYALGLLNVFKEEIPAGIGGADPEELLFETEVVFAIARPTSARG